MVNWPKNLNLRGTRRWEQNGKMRKSEGHMAQSKTKKFASSEGTCRKAALFGLRAIFSNMAHSNMTNHARDAKQQ